MGKTRSVVQPYPGDPLVAKTSSELDDSVNVVWANLGRHSERPDLCKLSGEPGLDTDPSCLRPVTESLGHQIQFHRGLRGWGPSELARRAEISRTALFRIERGTTSLPRAITLQRIAQAFQVTVDELLNEPSRPAAAATPPLLEPLSSACARCTNVPEVERMVLDLLQSPMGDWVIHLIEDTHRWLSTSDPAIPTMGQPLPAHDAQSPDKA